MTQPDRRHRTGRAGLPARPDWDDGPAVDTVGPMATSDTVITDELAIEIARLGLVRESSDVATLHRVTQLAARAVTGCAGATSLRWSTGGAPEPLTVASSHPDLAELVDLQLARGEGPIFDAVRSRRPVSCDDALAETRWPGHVAAMLRRGVRCFTTTVHEYDQVLITLTVYGVVPGALDPRQQALASLLLAQGGAAVSNTHQFDDVHRTAVQLQQAVEARAVVDQAKGILMHALGCDAERAFAELRRISQTRHVKLTAIAQRIVSGQGLPDDPPPGRDEAERA
ncbi:ANTAR domain-containing protein [Thermomonospora echinospora]|uniref:ANTAR domain-containing protein n=2 Tax=Thermomonospora echinospora TaxID=1992 RepID=A0A1H6E5Y1_9ACTN|nr:ANTAR domain-containing protein [Thermomonospora echinospora]